MPRVCSSSWRLAGEVKKGGVYGAIEGMAREQWVVVVVHDAYVVCVLSVPSAFGRSCHFTHLLKTAFAL